VRSRWSLQWAGGAGRARNSPAAARTHIERNCAGVVVSAACSTANAARHSYSNQGCCHGSSATTTCSCSPCSSSQQRVTALSPPPAPPACSTAAPHLTLLPPLPHPTPNPTRKPHPPPQPKDGTTWNDQLTLVHVKGGKAGKTDKEKERELQWDVGGPTISDVATAVQPYNCTIQELDVSAGAQGLVKTVSTRTQSVCLLAT